MVHHAVVLLRDINFTALLCKFSFNIHLLILLYFYRLRYCRSTPYWGFGLTLLKDCLILSEHLQLSNLISSVLLSTSYFNFFIVCRQVLLKIFIILDRPCVCFKLMWSVHYILAFCLLMLNLINFIECLLGRKRKFSDERNPISYTIFFFVCILFTFFSIYAVYGLIKSWVKASKMSYFNRLQT